MLTRLLLAFAFTAPLLAPKIATACSFAPQPIHSIDPAEEAEDNEPPERVEAVEVSVQRGHGPRNNVSTSCDDIGSVTLIPTPPSDNRTAPDELGYEIRLASGNAPDGLSFPSEAVRTMGENGAIYLRWVDGATDDQEPIDFSITLTPVDLGGNRGPESEPFRIHDPGSSASSSGCTIAAGKGQTSFTIGLVSLAFFGLLRRRR